MKEKELKELKQQIKLAKEQGTYTHNIYIKNKTNEIIRRELNLILKGKKLLGIKQKQNMRKYNNKSIEGIFPKVMFWDVDLNNIHIEDDIDFIIDRVLNRYIDIETLELLESIYLLDEIKYYAVEMDVMGNETIEFLCDRYKLKTKEFKYYIPKELYYATSHKTD